MADVICHEMAHMWFGDLVTMKWWNGIWLNEAFATFMEVLAVDAYRPEWQRWVSFGVEREAAMAVDGLHATRPVEFPVGRPEEAEGMFDVLTYQKGGSVLRMLEQFIGPDVFREGIHDYLVTHSYANTETRDLWEALERSSGRPVAKIMDTWIDQGGYPLVTVGDDGSLAQQPFSYSGAPGGAIGSRWQVPVLHRSLGSTDDWADALLLAGAGLDGTGGDDLVVNAGGSGYYRVAYSAERVAHLAGRLGDLAPLERYNLVSDTWAATLAGHARVADLLRSGQGAGRLGRGRPQRVVGGDRSPRAVRPDRPRGGPADPGRRPSGPCSARWPAGSGGTRPPPTTSGRRRCGRPSCARSGPSGPTPRSGPRPHAGSPAGRRHPSTATSPPPSWTSWPPTAEPAEYDAYLAHFRNPSTPQEKNRYLDALASFGDAALAARTFELAMTEVRSQDAPFLIRLLLVNRENGPATWERIVGAWDEFPKRFPSNTLPRMLDGVRALCAPPSWPPE